MNPAPTTTSRPIERRSGRRSGFTLIEILIVVAIISIVMALGLPAISRVTYQRLNSTTRQFVGMIKTIRNDAILLSVVHRLVLDMDKQEYWVEEQSGSELLANPDADNSKKKTPTKKDDDAPPAFNRSDKYGKKPKAMPGGVRIRGVLKAQEGFRTEGTVYIHFFPNGFNEQAIVQLARENDDSGGYSLFIRPASGRMEIMRSLVTDFGAVTP